MSLPPLRPPRAPVETVLLDLVDRGLVAASAIEPIAAGAEAPLPGADAIAARLAASSGGELFVSACGVRNLAALDRLYGARTADDVTRVLRAVVRAVAAEAGPGGLVARAQGPDVVLVHGAAGRAEAEAAARRLAEVLGRVALPTGQGAVHLRPVVATVEVAGTTPVEDLLRVLPEARARALRSDDGLAVLTASDAAETLDRLRGRDARLAWVTEALADERVDVHFQPVVDLRTGEVREVEALARVRTPDGTLAATDFINEVHALGETALLDAQVMRRVGERARELSRATGRLLINVSPLSLASPTFVGVMGRTIARLAGEGLRLVLVLELTEQALLEHHEIIRAIHREHGVTFAVDDFGTGYSSLRTVSDLAVERVISVLKIDGSLTRRIAESAEAYKVVLAVAQLARSLDLRVVAEHVETPEVLERLRTTGIECGQGYLFDPPLPAEELLARHPGPRRLAEPKTRPHLLLLEPYLHRAFEGFYEDLLGDPRFAGHFQGPEQVRRLVEKQRQTFLDSLEDDGARLCARYEALGALHAGLGVPLATFIEGAEILHRHLLDVLVHASRDVAVVGETERFFQGLEDHMARGHLRQSLPALGGELRDLAAWAASAASLPADAGRALVACAGALVPAATDRPVAPGGEPAGGDGACPFAAPAEAAGAGSAHRQLHAASASVAWLAARGRERAIAPVLQEVLRLFQGLAIELAGASASAPR
jgi:EAL domain-containing protein (putative c-di-GMP-specific phosphodiesterase class I)/GGDEF domain-containing protein